MVEEKSKKVRPSELPIYSHKIECTKTEEPAPPPPQFLLDTIRQTRQTYYNFKREVTAYKKVGRDNAEWLVSYLQEEDNTVPKAGAIAIGAFTGFILGLRGRTFKRLFYATCGGVGMAALCYPRQAAEYGALAQEYTGEYTTVAYNFIYGVKKGDPPVQLPTLPKLPTSFSEAWDTVVKTTSSLVSDEKKSEVKKE